MLNHKRLLDSARADPTAVSFQLRPVDVVSSDIAKHPSFGSLDMLQLAHAEVRSGSCWGRVGAGHSADLAAAARGVRACCRCRRQGSQCDAAGASCRL